MPGPHFCLEIHIQQMRLYIFSVLQAKHIPNQNDYLSTPESILFICGTMAPTQSHPDCPLATPHLISQQP